MRWVSRTAPTARRARRRRWGRSRGSGGPSRSRQPGCSAIASRTLSTPPRRSPVCAAARPAQNSSSWLPGRRRARGRVLRGGLVVAALAGEVVALGGQRVGVGEVEQAVELGERIGVVVDAQVDEALATARPARARPRSAADWRPRASPPLPSAACSAASRRRASGPAAASNACGHRGPHLGRGHHVRLRAEALARLVAGPVDAAVAGVHGDLAAARRRSPPGGSARPRRRRSGRRARPGRPDGRRRRAGRARAGRSRGRRSTASPRRRRPARTQGTIGPTPNQCDCTAAPSSPGLRVAGDDRVGASADHGDAA